jgi:hypothetical protein
MSLCLSIMMVTISVSRGRRFKVVNQMFSGGGMDHVYAIVLPSRDPRFCRSVLAAVCFSYRPLSYAELHVASGFDSIVFRHVIVDDIFKHKRDPQEGVLRTLANLLRKNKQESGEIVELNVQSRPEPVNAYIKHKLSDLERNYEYSKYEAT